MGQLGEVLDADEDDRDIVRVALRGKSEARLFHRSDLVEVHQAEWEVAAILSDVLDS